MGEKNAQMKSICCGGKKKRRKKWRSTLHHPQQDKIILWQPSQVEVDSPQSQWGKMSEGGKGEKKSMLHPWTSLPPESVFPWTKHSLYFTLVTSVFSSTPNDFSLCFAVIKKKQLLFKKSSSYFGRCFKAAVTQVYDLTLLHLWNVVQQPTRVGSTSSVKDS